MVPVNLACTCLNFAELPASRRLVNVAAAVVTGRRVRPSGEATSHTRGPAAGRRLRHAAAHIGGVHWPRPTAVLHWAQYLF